MESLETEKRVGSSRPRAASVVATWVALMVAAASGGAAGAAQSAVVPAPERAAENGTARTAAEEDEEGVVTETRGRAPRGARGPLLAAGYLHSFDTPIDDGGSFATNTAFAAARLGFPIGAGFILGAQVSWQGDWYSFDGANRVAPPPDAKPWADIQSFAGSVSLGRRLGNWWLNGAFTARFSFEVGASIGDGFNPGGILGAQYTFSPGLRLGGGVLVNARLEESPLIVPIPFVYWEISEQLVLSNTIAPDAYPRGPGIEIAWRPTETWALALGGRWEFRRFRLDDDGPEIRRGGVGEDEGIPLWLRLTYRLRDNLRADVLGGYSVGNRLRLADARGNDLLSSGTEPIPYLGAFVAWQF